MPSTPALLQAIPAASLSRPPDKILHIPETLASCLSLGRLTRASAHAWRQRGEGWTGLRRQPPVASFQRSGGPSHDKNGFIATFVSPGQSDRRRNRVWLPDVCGTKGPLGGTLFMKRTISRCALLSRRPRKAASHVACSTAAVCLRSLLARRAPGVVLEEAPRTWEVRQAVLAAARSLHRAGVVHGDLAPCNILVDTTDPVPVTSTSPLAVCVHLLLPVLVLEPCQTTNCGSPSTIPVHCKRIFIACNATTDQQACRESIEQSQWHFSPTLVSSDLLSAAHPKCA